MSVLNLAVPDEFVRTALGNATCSCFFCAEEIRDVAVLWHGAPRSDSDDANVFLHPGCAEQLAIRLIRDGFEATRLMAGKPPLAGICKSLIPDGEA